MTLFPRPDKGELVNAKRLTVRPESYFLLLIVSEYLFFGVAILQSIKESLKLGLLISQHTLTHTLPN